MCEPRGRGGHWALGHVRRQASTNVESVISTKFVGSERVRFWNRESVKKLTDGCKNKVAHVVLCEISHLWDLVRVCIKIE